MNNWRLMKNASVSAFMIATLALAGCSAVQRVGMGLFYLEAPLGEARMIPDIPYVLDGDPRHQLNLFCPPGKNWPVIVFVFGGGWTTGDKGLRVGGKDVYGNIGRFYAARGIGVAVINYRLQPLVNWRDQVDDVAAATMWVKRSCSEFGADTNSIFLAGHSAGAHLANFVALNAELRAKYSIGPGAICGVVSASGAGLDMADEETYRLGESREYYKQRFCPVVCEPGWEEEASPIHYVTAKAPEYLILYAQGEKKGLQRQSKLLSQELSKHSVPAKLIGVSGQSHQRMVLVLSRPDRMAADAILDFIKQSRR